MGSCDLVTLILQVLSPIIALLCVFISHKYAEWKQARKALLSLRTELEVNMQRLKEVVDAWKEERRMVVVPLLTEAYTTALATCAILKMPEELRGRLNYLYSSIQIMNLRSQARLFGIADLPANYIEWCGSLCAMIGTVLKHDFWRRLDS